MNPYKSNFFEKYETRENLKNYFKNLNLKFVSLKQIHGNEVLVANILNVDEYATNPPTADACISNLENLVLSVHTADCLPVLAYGDSWFGVCHAGWRGVTNGMLNKFIQSFFAQGISPEALHLSVGPAICKNHFEVHLDVAAQLSQCVFGASKYILPHSDQTKKRVDLKSIALLQIQTNGIKRAQVDLSQDCTYCRPEKYFSFRRDKIKGCLNESIIYK